VIEVILISIILIVIKLRAIGGATLLVIFIIRFVQPRRAFKLTPPVESFLLLLLNTFEHLLFLFHLVEVLEHSTLLLYLDLLLTQAIGLLLVVKLLLKTFTDEQVRIFVLNGVDKFPQLDLEVEEVLSNSLLFDLLGVDGLVPFFDTFLKLCLLHV